MFCIVTASVGTAGPAVRTITNSEAAASAPPQKFSLSSKVDRDVPGAISYKLSRRDGAIHPHQALALAAFAAMRVRLVISVK